MKHYFNKKTIKKTVLLIGLSFLISGAIIIVNELKNPMRMAFAENENHNLSGYAWNDNYGWISFNCSNKTCEKNRSIPCKTANDCLKAGVGGDCNDTCSTKNYGVNIDKNTGNLSGYAWSPNIGWISFQENHNNAPDKGAILSNCSDNSCSSTNSCSACYNPTNKKMFGWAKILSLKEKGWLRLDNSTALSYAGVRKKSDACELEGWAYNNNDDKVGLGWLSFNSSNPEDDPDAVNYAVNFNIQPQDFSITESGSGPGKGTAPSNCYIGLTWENKGDCGTGFEIWRSKNSNSNFGSAPYKTVDCNQNTYLDTPGKLTVGNKYYYYIINKGNCGTTESNTVGPYSPTICPVEPKGASFVAKASCDRVTLSWKDTDADHYDIWRDVNKGSGYTGNYVKISKKITDDNSSDYTYDDTDITSDYKYNYMLKAYQGTGPYCGECSVGICGSTNCYVKTTLSTSLYPCPKLPANWKETKPE